MDVVTTGQSVDKPAHDRQCVAVVPSFRRLWRQYLEVTAANFGEIPSIIKMFRAGIEPAHSHVSAAPEAAPLPTQPPGHASWGGFDLTEFQ